MRKTTLTLAVVLGFGLAAPAQAMVTEGFDGLGIGVDTLIADGTEVFGGLGTVSSSNRDLALYDTSGSSNADRDLNYADTGLALIFQKGSKNGRVGRSNDHANGGEATFDFTNAISLVSLALYDFERGEKATFSSNLGVILEIVGAAPERSGNNQSDAATVVIDFANENIAANPAVSFSNVNWANAVGITSWSIVTDASTAIDDIVVTPLPAGVALFGTALAGLAFFRRRRAQAAAA